MPWERRMFSTDREKWDPRRMEKERSRETIEPSQQSTYDDLREKADYTATSAALTEIHAWRRRLDKKYQGSEETEQFLDHFSKHFISLAERFDVTAYPARRFLEGTRGTPRLSKKGTAIVAAKNSFRVAPRVIGDASAYLARTWEEGNRFAGRDAIEQDCYLDAPFGYALEFKNKDGKWEVISLCAALPDERNKVLIVEQVQGNGGVSDLTPEALSMRSNFNTAICVPFAAMLELAERTGLTTIMLRKPEAIGWRGHDAKSNESPYIQLARRFHMVSSTADHFSADVTALLSQLK